MEGQNMLTMLKADNAVTAQEMAFVEFERRVVAILECDPFPFGSDEESMLSDLFADGCTPEDAALEVQADWDAAADVRAESRAERCLSPGYGT